MKKRFRGDYGSSASITEHGDGTATLRIRLGSGRLVKNSTHKNLNAARSAMQRFGDGWTEVKKARSA